jgi:hypothetical protein
MDDVFEDWKKEMEDKMKRFIEKEELDKPIQKQRCPKCMKIEVEFNPDTGCLKCKSCDFEYCVKKVN